ncbi:Serine phosphatase RsbU, regulator of sigma subunit [Micromonospora nigra]|uniref:Serine phosphatase RsbU, regulator of sigma subunit n=1 Tax=Micromonospora nigra TaxID=145857 RepID=A0A1C6RMF6_9ACTN|nr:SpoIIE family protein phosphatase [Micromonospora nigra]SCL18356.1 Serine phosphatase RsbU, regulator of sigma subunit [Micromonospora nigra]
MTTTRRGEVSRPVSGGGQDFRTRPAHPLPADPGLARELLDGLAEAVVTTDPAGMVVLVNAMAARLLPELGPGISLPGCPVPAIASAVESGADTFDAEHRGRRLRGTRRDLAGGRSAWYVRDITEDVARTDALLAERSRTAFLARAGSRLGMSLHRDQTLRAAATLPVPYLADLALVVHLPSPPAEDAPHWVRYTLEDGVPVTGVAGWEITGAVPGLAEALAGDTTGPSPGRDVDLTDLGAIVPPSFGRADTVLVRPIVDAGRPTGALVLVRRAGRAGFDGRDVDLAREFATRAGAALATAELYGEQTHLARVLQHSLLPPELPAVAGLTLAGGYRAAGDSLRIGGDFYDVRPTTDGALFVLGDVCGKGVGAAVLTGRVRQSLQTLRLVEQRPLELMRLLNRALLDIPDAARHSQLTTLLLGRLDAEPNGGVRVRVAGGGHPDPLLVRADGTVAPVRVGGMPVGTLAVARFVETEVRLEPGDVLLAHTDGVTDARGGPREAEPFGEARLRRALSSGAGLPPAALVAQVLQLVDEWLDGQGHDDIAMLAVAARP